MFYRSEPYGSSLSAVNSTVYNLAVLTPVLCRVLTVRSRKLECLWCWVAILTHVYTSLRIRSGGDTEYNAAYVLTPARALSEVIFVGFMCKSIWRLIFHENEGQSRWSWTAALLVGFLRSCGEYQTQTRALSDEISYDTNYYLILTCVMMSARAALQGIIINAYKGGAKSRKMWTGKYYTYKGG